MTLQRQDQLSVQVIKPRPNQSLLPEWYTDVWHFEPLRPDGKHWAQMLNARKWKLVS